MGSLPHRHNHFLLSPLPNILVNFSIADVSTSRVEVGVALRSSVGGVGVAVKVGSIDMTGRPVEGEAPPIISTDLNSSEGIPGHMTCGGGHMTCCLRHNQTRCLV